MGIKNLSKIINRYASNAINYHKIDHYKNKTIAIDGNLLLYKMIFAIRKNGYDLKNDNIIVTHLFTMLQKIKAFIKYNITPVFVFDGTMPHIKSDTIEKRKQFQAEMQKKYYSAVTQDEKKKYYFMKSKISLQEIRQTIQLVKLFGYTVVEAPEEADGQLARMFKDKLVDYIVTDDMDILIFGASNILKNFTVSDKKKIQEIDLNVFKKKTQLNQNKIVDLGILLGCDYCPTVAGVGTIGSYNLIKKYGSIESIIKNEQINVPYNYHKVRKYFKNPTTVKINSINKLNPNIPKLTKFLVSFKFKDKIIDDIKKRLNSININ